MKIRISQSAVPLTHCHLVAVCSALLGIRILSCSVMRTVQLDPTATSLYPGDAPSGLKLIIILADGNCLYRAVSATLEVTGDGTGKNHNDLRALAAEETKVNAASYASAILQHAQSSTEGSCSHLVSTMFINAMLHVFLDAMRSGQSLEDALLTVIKVEAEKSNINVLQSLKYQNQLQKKT